MKHQTRRAFLTVGGGAFAALALRSVGGCGPDEGTTTTSGGAPPGPSAEWTLDVQFAEIPFTTITQGPIKAKLRTYGGTIPGPRIKTFPGDKLKIWVRNNLTDETEKDLAEHHTWMQLPERLQHIVPHMFNATNLHVHGVETVPHLFEPVGTSEPTSSMIAIEPGDDYHYVFPIPEDHAPGLYWYHPHHHGSTAVQVQNGMAGAILILGAIDEVPEIKAAQDIAIVVQDVCLFPPAPGSDLWMFSPTQNAIWQTFPTPVKTGSDINAAILLRDKDGKTLQQQDREGNQYTPAGELDPTATPIVSGFSTGDFPLRLFLVNSTLVYEEVHNTDPMNPTKPVGHQHKEVPRFTIRPGEVVRFRLLNGCSDNMVPLVVEQHTMHVLGMDGVNFPSPRERDEVLLGPGNRVEFLVKGSSTPGVYAIKQVAQTAQFLASDEKRLAEIEVAGEPLDMPLPATLPTSPRHYPLIPEGTYKKRNIVFGMYGPVFDKDNVPATYNKIVGIDFFMTTEKALANDPVALADPVTWEGTEPSANKGLAYVEERVDLVDLKVGEVEEWTIEDNSMMPIMHGSMEGHPFHLHETSFEVIEINGKALGPDEITLQDTVWVPHMGSVKIRLRFAENAVGKSVTHCHIIPHEECGMMMNTLITR